MDKNVETCQFDYEELLFNELNQNRHLWIKKATGLGITEFMIRYMAWLCFKDSTLQGAKCALSPALALIWQWIGRETEVAIH